MGRASKLKKLRKFSRYKPGSGTNEVQEGKTKVYAQIVINEAGDPEIKERVEKSKQIVSTGSKKIYKAYKRALKDGLIKVPKN